MGKLTTDALQEAITTNGERERIGKSVRRNFKTIAMMSSTGLVAIGLFSVTVHYAFVAHVVPTIEQTSILIVLLGSLSLTFAVLSGTLATGPGLILLMLCLKTRRGWGTFANGLPSRPLLAILFASMAAASTIFACTASYVPDRCAIATASAVAAAIIIQLTAILMMQPIALGRRAMLGLILVVDLIWACSTSAVAYLFTTTVFHLDNPILGCLSFAMIFGICALYNAAVVMHQGEHWWFPGLAMAIFAAAFGQGFVFEVPYRMLHIGSASVTSWISPAFDKQTGVVAYCGLKSEANSANYYGVYVVNVGSEQNIILCTHRGAAPRNYPIPKSDSLVIW